MNDKEADHGAGGWLAWARDGTTDMLACPARLACSATRSLRTVSMCLPQPCQVGLPHVHVAW